jgi:hypothetical protein
MRIDLEEYPQLIDSVINTETHRASIKDMHNMTLHGVELPNPNQMEDYIFNLRTDIQKVLEKSN